MSVTLIQGRGNLHDPMQIGPKDAATHDGQRIADITNGMARNRL